MISTAVKKGWVMFRFLWAYWRANWQGAMEFRASFLTQAVSMLLNNSVWIVFWWLYFSRFPVVKGWTMEDILWLWAIAAGAVGWVSAFFGNVFRLAHMIANGHLDLYLTMPKPVLLHLLVSRMSFSAWGDILFAWILFAAIGEGWLDLVKFLAAQLLGGIIVLGVMILVQCLAFIIGNAEGIAQQVQIALLTFTTYPIDIFSGVPRILLFTVLPAGLISSMPVTFIRDFSWSAALWAAGVAMFFLLASVWLFRKGLRRYESGNMIGLRM
ncbi:MAG: ABC-2 family transporter protein [Planifilum fulgidum]